MADPEKDVSLQIIGASFGRTGTLSLKMALEKLRFGPCHHMVEVFDNPGLLERWQRVIRGDPIEWDEVFQDYRSCVDWPAAAYWQSLADHYPDARVILTTRDPYEWYTSFERTILRTVQSTDRPANAHIRATLDMAESVLRDCVFGGAPPTREWSIRRFRSNERMVQRVIDPDRLLIFDVREGWEPLCEFLNTPIPETEFPCVNREEQFKRLFDTTSIF